MARSRGNLIHLMAAPRCHARAKSTGEKCKAPAVRGKRVCRVHGGAKGSGAPKGPANGQYRHGLYTNEAIREKRAISILMRMLAENPD